MHIDTLLLLAQTADHGILGTGLYATFCKIPYFGAVFWGSAYMRPLSIYGSLDFFNVESFGFDIFGGDVIIRVGLRIFGRGHPALGANTKSQFFYLSFSKY